MRALVFANGKFDPTVKEIVLSNDLLVCADGGANHALACGLTPHAVVGDFDSISEEVLAELERSGVALHRSPINKDETDLELAIEFARQQGASDIMIVCALGNRLDHMLGNLLHLGSERYSQMTISLMDEDELVRVVRPGTKLKIRARPGDNLSILPITDQVARVNLTGVEWPLNNATLALGTTLSISNRFKESNAQLSIEGGTALLMVPRSATID